MATQRVKASITTPSMQSSSPENPWKAHPSAAVAVNVTVMPFVKFSAQALSVNVPSARRVQLIPAGSEVTVPAPSMGTWSKKVGDSVNSKTGWHSTRSLASIRKLLGFGQLGPAPSRQTSRYRRQRP